MKKRLFYLFFTIALGIGLSSCLDDAADYSMSSTNFAVIKNVDKVATPVVWVENGLLMTWEGISSEHSMGDAMILYYDVNLNDQSNGVVNADPTKIKVVEKFPSASHKRINIMEADTLVDDTSNMFESLSNKSFVSNQFLDDKWLFLAKAKMKEGQTMDLEFYYDSREGMQHTSIGGALPEGVVVLDVKLNIRGAGDGTAESKDKYFVVDLSKLRNEIFKNATENAQCNLWLRYYDRTKSETKPSYTQNIGVLIHEVAKTN